MSNQAERIAVSSIPLPQFPKPSAYELDEHRVLKHLAIAAADGIDVSKHRIEHINGNGLDNRRCNLYAVPYGNPESQS